MKNIWILYIIMAVFFLLGDIISTALVITNAEDKLPEEVRFNPKCVCKLPPECETSPYFSNELEKRDSPLQAFRNAFIMKIIILVILGAITYYFGAKAWLILLLIALFSVSTTFRNLGLFLFKYYFYVMMGTVLVWIFILNKFVKFREAENGK